MIKTILAIALAVTLTACGGGGGGDAPVANVDRSQAVTEYVDFNFETVYQQRIPGAGLISMFKDEKLKIMSVSDEPFWHVLSATGNRFIDASTSARNQGYRSMAIFTPYATNAKAHGILSKLYPEAGFGLTTEAQMQAMIQHIDVVGIDPYHFGDHLMTMDELMAWTNQWIDLAHAAGKPVMVITYGMNTPNNKTMAVKLAQAGADYMAQFTYFHGISDEARLSPEAAKLQWDASQTIKENLGNVRAYVKKPSTPNPVLGQWTCVNGQATYRSNDLTQDLYVAPKVNAEGADTLGNGGRVVQLPAPAAPANTCPV